MNTIVQQLGWILLKALPTFILYPILLEAVVRNGCALLAIALVIFPLRKTDDSPLPVKFDVTPIT